MSRSTVASTIDNHRPHRCPWWLGWVLINPIRQLLEDPQRLVIPLVEPRRTVLEIGPGMGFFTVPIAKHLGPQGRIYCVDVQAKMLAHLHRRLQRRGLADRVELRQCQSTDLGIADLANSVDLAMLVHVLHEVEDPRTTMRDVAATLRPKGKLLLVEPPGHVDAGLFQAELAIARECGLSPIEPCPVAASRRRMTAVLVRASG
jgi:SAM-dependent methyltransferase